MTYDHFIASLDGADAFERLTAFDAFRMDAGAAAVARVAGRLLADADPGVREEASRALVALATDEAARQTVPYLAGDDIVLRNLAGEILAGIGAPSVQALAPLLDDPDRGVRKFAIDVLALLPAQELADRIAARLDDEDENVVLAAVDALGSLGAVAYEEALRALYASRPLARPHLVAALGAFESGVDLDFLAEALADEDPVVQYTAAEALARRDAPGVLDLLLRTVEHVDPMARPVVLGSIVTCYEEHPDRVVLPVAIKGYLFEMLDDVDPAYRCLAVRGLRAFLDEDVVDGLVACAGRDDALDVELFNTLAAFPRVFPRIVRNVEAGRIAADHGGGFVLGLLAHQCIVEEELDDVNRFLVDHFDAFEAETKVAAVGLSANLRHPALHAVIRAGLIDANAEVSAFAADAACTVGLDASQGARPSTDLRARP